MTFELPPDPRVGTVLADRYRIERVIGEGAMGKVYAAEHVLMRKRLAVKVLHRELSSVPELVQRFEREAMAAANIDHPNIASATDFGKLEDGAVFLALELVEGRCLRDEIAKGPMASVRALHITRQIAAALGSAHALSIVHRDLKPENVMLVEKNGDPDFVKVLDFGVARVPIGDAAGGGGVITRAGMVFGTPEYIPPEQALGQASDGRADLYSLGVMLFEMLAGSRPFVADSKVSLVGQHLGKPPPRLVERGITAPEAVEGLVLRLLEKESARRPQDAEEVVKTVDVLLGKPQRGPFHRPTRAQNPKGAAGLVLERWKDARSLARGAFVALTDFVDQRRKGLPKALASPLARVPSRTLALSLSIAAFAVLALAAGGLVGALARGSDEVAVGTPPLPSGSALTSARAPSTQAPMPSASALPSPEALEADKLLGEARSLALAKDYPAAVAKVARALSLDPARKNDGRAATVLFQSAQAKASFDKAFELLEGPMEERGAAIAHDLAVFAPKRGKAQVRAEAFLDSPRFQAIAAPPLRLAASLRRSRRCADVRSILVEVKKVGDKHSLPYLQFFRENLKNYPCLKTDTLLADAQRAVEARAKATQE